MSVLIDIPQVAYRTMMLEYVIKDKDGKHYICPTLGACFEGDNFFCAYGERRDYGNEFTNSVR